MNILLIYGGISWERTGSLASADNILSSLKDINVNVYTMDYNGDSKSLIEFIGENQIDLVFNTMHGKLGEDGVVQGFFDVLKMPYIGSGVLGSALSMNKYITKLVLKGAGYKVAEGICAKSNGDDSSVKIPLILKEKGLNYPLIVKPNNQGSKLGISLATNEDDLFNSIDSAFQYDHEIVIEQFINGKEIAVCMYYKDNEKFFLPLVEVGHDLLDKTFMINEKSHHIIPARIDTTTSDNIVNIASEIFDLFSIKDYGRIDMIIDGDDYQVAENRMCYISAVH